MAYNNTGTFTITGTNGPGFTVTAAVIQNVTSWVVDLLQGTIQLNLANGTVEIFGINAATTFTVTISSGNYTVTIS